MPTPYTRSTAHKDLHDSPFFKLAQQTRNTPANKGKRKLLDEDLPSSDEEEEADAFADSSSCNSPAYTLNAPPARPTRSRLAQNQLDAQQHTQSQSQSQPLFQSRLPVAVESLIDLHNAVENAFRIHLSTSSALPPPAVMPYSETHAPQHSSLQTYEPGLHILRFNTLIDLATLSKLVASSSSKNLNAATLAKLKYLWNDDIGFVIATTRVKEYSIGMEVAIEEEKKAKGAIGVMRDFARAKEEWYRQTDRRREIVIERAKVWVEEQFDNWMNKQLDDVTKTPKSHTAQQSSSITRSGLLTPPSTATKARKGKERATPQSPCDKAYPADFLRSVTNTPSKQLPHLPMKSRPKTPSDALKRMASYNNAEKLLQTAPVKRARVKSPSPPPRSLKKAKSVMTEEDDNTDVFRTPSKAHASPFATPTKPPATMSMAERKKNLEASVRAKMELKKKAREEELELSGLGGSDRAKQSHAVKSQVFQRRSRLSRLPAVAEAVYLLFAPNVSNVPSSPSASLPTPTSRKRRARPLLEVASVIVKSSKVAMSAAEACDSLKMLCTLCPDFLFTRTVDRVEYLEMPTMGASSAAHTAANAIVPPSPSTHPLLAATTPSSPQKGSTNTLTYPPKSPRSPLPPKSPKSPLSGTEVDSPSKRKSAMTLREVRMVISRELDKNV